MPPVGSTGCNPAVGSSLFQQRLGSFSHFVRYMNLVIDDAEDGIAVPDVGYTVRPNKVVSRVPMTGNHGEEEDSACHWPLAETSYTSF